MKKSSVPSSWSLFAVDQPKAFADHVHTEQRWSTGRDDSLPPGHDDLPHALSA
jgi:hypothetical protein